MEQPPQDEVVDREPHRAPPVRVATEHAGVGLGRQVVHLVHLPVDVEDERVVEVVAGQRPQAVGAEELVLVEHPRQHPAQLALVEDGQHPAAVHPRLAEVVDVLQELGHGVEPAPEPGEHVVADLDPVEAEHRARAQRQEADDRPDLQALGPPVGEAEHVVEEPVLLVPQLVVVVADPVHGGGDEHEVLGELDGHVLVHRVVLRRARGRCRASTARRTPSTRCRPTARGDRRSAAVRSGRRRRCCRGRGNPPRTRCGRWDPCG